MRWNILALMAALLLVSTFTSPRRVEAQGFDEKARILTVMGIGTDQQAEIYLRSHRPASHPPPGAQGGSFSFRFTISPGSRGEEVCAQAIQATVAVTSGLNMLTVATTEANDEFLINGEFVAQLDPTCFNSETKRVIVKVSAPISASMASQTPVAPNSAPPGLSNVIAGSTVVNRDGSTAASDGVSLVMERSFSVWGMGENETAEIHLSGQRNDQTPRSAPGDSAVFTYVVTNPGDATCTQTIEKSVLEQALLERPMLSVFKGFGFVTFDDGETIVLEDECFKDPQSQRVAIQVAVQGGDRRIKIPENNSPYPIPIPAPFPVVGSILVVGPDGETRASTGMGRVFPKIEIEEPPFW